MAGNDGRYERSTSEGVAGGKDARTVRRAKDQPNRATRRLMQRRGIKQLCRLPGLLLSARAAWSPQEGCQP